MQDPDELRQDKRDDDPDRNRREDARDRAVDEALRVEVQCLSCGRWGSFDGHDRRVSGAPLVQLTRRLVCSACGSRAVRATAIRTPRDLARRLRSRMGEPHD